MKKNILFTALGLLAWAAPLLAQPMEIITYQGRLKDNSLPASGNYSFAFDLCDAAATDCYPAPELSQNFLVTNGLFKSTFTLPSVNLFSQPWYLRVSVGGVALSPMERLTFVPYSVYASTAANSLSSVRLSGDTMTGQLTLAGSTLTVTGNAFSVGGSTLSVRNGNVGIGTAAPYPYSKLHVVTGGTPNLENITLESPASNVGFALNFVQPEMSWGVGQNIGNYADGRFQVMDLNSATARLTLLRSGRLGIGSTDPAYLLSVSSGAGEAGNIVVISTGASEMIRMTGGGEIFAAKFIGDGSGITGVTGATGTDPNALPKTGGTLTGNLVVHDSTLSVTGGGIMLSSAGAAQLAFTVNPAGASITTLGANPIHIGAGQLATLALDASGNVGVNKDAGPYRLDVGGSANIEGQVIAGGTLTVQGAVFSVGGSTLVAAAGNVGIGTDAPQSRLDIYSSGSSPADMVQIWRDFSGIVVSSVSATGSLQAVRFIGDGSGLTNVAGVDAGKLPLAGGTMTGALDLGNNYLSNVSTITMYAGSIAIVPPGTGGNNGGYGISIGSGSFNNYSAGVGVGWDTRDNYNNGVGVGYFAHNNYTEGVGLGYNAQNNYNSGLGVGPNTTFNHSSGVGVGSRATSNSNYGLGLGAEASYNKNYGVGVGAYASGNDDYAVGVGAYSQNNAGYGAALGAYSYASSSGTALGAQAKANAELSLALGYGTVNNSTGTASFGNYAVYSSSSIGIGGPAQQARLDVQGVTGMMTQVWRDSAGVIVSSVNPAGYLQAVKFIGDGSGLTNVAAATGVDATKLPLAGGTLTGPLQIQVGAAPVAFQVGVSTFVVKDGLVGINNAAPGQALDVAGNIWTTGSLGVGDSPNGGDIHIRKIVPAGTVQLNVENASNLAGADAEVLIQVGGPGANDPMLDFSVAGVMDWSIGIDNSDADKLKISESGAVGTNDRFSVTSYGGASSLGAGDISGVQIDTTSALHVVAKGAVGSDGRVAVFGDLRSNGSVAGQYLAAGNFETSVDGPDVAEAVIGVRAKLRRETAGGGLVTNAYGLMIDDLQNQAGTIGKTYGIYIGDQTSGTQTDPAYSLYASDPNTRNYFAGPVGIGTDTPAYSLDITGNLNSSGGYCISGNCISSWASVTGAWTRNATVISPFTPTDNVLIQSTLTVAGNAFSVGGSTLTAVLGNIGIGTSSPLDMLHIEGSSPWIRFKNTGGSTAASLGMDTAGKLRFDNAGVGNVMTLDVPNTRLGIGALSPGYTLDVGGTIRAATPAGSNGRIILGDGDVNHGMTGLNITSDTFGHITANSPSGGLHVGGYSGAPSEAGLYLAGVIGDENPAGGIPAVRIAGSKRNGTASQNMGSNETLFDIVNGGARLLTVLGGGRVGIGAMSPGAQLEIRDVAAASPYLIAAGTGPTGAFFSVSTDSVVGVGYGVPSTHTVLHAQAVATNVTGGEDVMAGLIGSARAVGTGPEDVAVGGDFKAEADGSQNLGYLAGLHTAVERTGAGGGMINTAVGLYVEEPRNSSGPGGFTNTYGIYIATQTSGIQTNPPYAIYSVDKGARAYFAGKVGIGTDAPGYALHISSAAGSAEQMLVISTGGVTVFGVKGNGEVYASGKITGDGSGLTNVSAIDTSKLPLSGGMLTGALTLNGSSLTVSSTGEFARLDSSALYGNVSFWTGGTTQLGNLGFGSNGTFFLPAISQSMALTGYNGLHLGVGADPLITMTTAKKVGIGVIIAPQYSLDVSTANDTDAYVARFGANGVLISTGGAIQTTGTGTGPVAGNARGIGAVDLQTYRDINTQVASGNYSSIGGGIRNSATYHAATVSGGQSNRALSYYATVGGGNTNQAGGHTSLVAGGAGNTASGIMSAVTGGESNQALAAYSFAGAGYYNVVSGSNSANGGGAYNVAAGTSAVVAGGEQNKASGMYSGVLGGNFNTASGIYSGVLSGSNNQATFENSVVAGGRMNDASGSYAAIGGGFSNIVQASGGTSTIAGGEQNIVYTSNNGSAIGGGTFNTIRANGNYETVSGGYQNTIYENAWYSSIAGGGNNIIGNSARASSIGGGSLNRVYGSSSTVAGGSNNVANSTYAFVGGGSGNTAYDQYSAVAGGLNNYAGATGSFVGGGTGNNAGHTNSAIAGGQTNNIFGLAGFVGGGEFHTIDGQYGAVAGGSTNKIRSDAHYAFIGGGAFNISTAPYSTIGGGLSNTSSGTYSGVFSGHRNEVYAVGAVIAGGDGNYAGGTYSFVGGGYANQAPGNYSAIAGGAGNSTDLGQYSFIGAGQNNVVNSLKSAIGGGDNNQIVSVSNYSGIFSGQDNLIAAGINAVISGGYANTAQNDFATVSGGVFNYASAYAATVAGGANAAASGQYSMVAGGNENAAVGDYSFAAGRKSSSTAIGSFTWSDSIATSALINSVANQVMFKASGGFWVSTGTVYTDPALYVRPDNSVAVGMVTTPTQPARLQVNGDLGLGNGTQTGNAPVVIWLTAAGAVADGDIVVASGGNQFSTTVTGSDYRAIGVAVGATLASNVGKVAVGGVAVVNCSGATAGQHAVTSGVAGQAVGQNNPTSGTSIGQFLTSCGTPAAGKAYLLVK